jgi:hypothetical protein
MAISGTSPAAASAIAGARFAAAVPEVHTTAAGRPVTCAVPKAKNAAARSSVITHLRISGRWSSARTSGVERDPGAMHASRSPHRASSSTSAAAARALAFASQLIALPRPLSRAAQSARGRAGARVGA